MNEVRTNRWMAIRMRQGVRNNRRGKAGRQRRAGKHATKPAQPRNDDSRTERTSASTLPMKFNVTYAIYSSMGDAQCGPMSEGKFRIEAVDEATAQQFAEHEIQHTDPTYDSR